MGHMLEQYGEMASFASLRQPAWHGLGTVFDEAVTTSEMLRPRQPKPIGTFVKRLSRFLVVTTAATTTPTFAPTPSMVRLTFSALSVPVTVFSKTRNCLPSVTTSLTVVERGRRQAPSKTAQSFSVRCLSTVKLL